jgi:hypothetical protein
MLTWSLSGALWMLIAGGGEIPIVPVLTSAPPRAAAALPRIVAGSRAMSSRARLSTFRVSGALPAATIRTSFLVAGREPRSDGQAMTGWADVAEPDRAGASASVRALRLDPPRTGRGGGPLATHLTLTLTGDRRSLDADVGVKGGVASAVRYALQR